MKQLTKTKLISVLFLLLLMSGCTEADVTRNDNPGQQTGEVETTFDLKVAPSATPMTRSIILTDKGATEVDTLAVATPASADTLQTRSATELPDAQEKKVAGLWIGQYNAAGTTLLSHQYIESVTGTQVTAKLVVANNCKVRFVANAGNLGAIETETLLDAKTLAYASTADGRPQSNLFAMTGTWTGDITKETTSLPLPTGAPAVMLTRLAAKITFTYKINGEGFTFTPTAVSLKNVPNCSQIGELTTQLASGITYGNYTGTINKTGATIYWYLPENMAGTAAGTNAVQSEKEKTGRGVNNATYIELFGNAVQNGVTYTDVAFRFYPGKDENDYNVKRNDHFVMSIDLKGIDISDKRITIGNIPDITAPTGNLPATGGSKEVQITSRAGVVWSLPIPDWLSATMNGQITPGGSTLTYQGAGKVTFTAGMNQTAEVRSKAYTIKLDDDKSQSFTIAQDSSVMTTGPGISLYAVGSERASSFTATQGLPWSASLNKENGDWFDWADNNPDSSGIATGLPQELKIKATASNPSANTRYANAGIYVKAGKSVSDPDYAGLKKVIGIRQYGSTLTILEGDNPVETPALPLTNAFFRFSTVPGLPWSATSDNDWISISTPSGNTAIDGDGYGTVIFSTTTTNPLASKRSGSITVVAGGQADSPKGTCVVNQAGFVFDLSANVLNLDTLEATNSTITVTGSPGLVWTVTPSTETNGITLRTTGGTADGSPQAITFHATENNGVATRTATFTVSTPVSPSLTKTITVYQEGIGVTINQDMLTKYAISIASLVTPDHNLTNYPPFDTDNDGGQSVKDKHHISFTLNDTSPTMTGSYKFQVESTQSPDFANYSTQQSYCSTLNVDGHSDWRLPTFIELYAMWDKAKGTNNNAVDNEPESKIFGAKFLSENVLSGWHWSSSVYGGNASGRCILYFIDGSLSTYHTNQTYCVRCVRDL